jgi:cellulose synthase (UDP-forming)
MSGGNSGQNAANIIRETVWSWIALLASEAATTTAFTYYLALASAPTSKSALIGLFVALPLVYGIFVYKLTRLGSLKREQMHRPVEREELERIYDDTAPSLSILIPSYKEDPQVLRQTLISAALVEYPGRQIVVLIDDPPDDHACRKTSRGVVEDVSRMMSKPADLLEAELKLFHRRKSATCVDAAVERANLVKLYNELADWFESRAAEFETNSDNLFGHVDRFFIDNILVAPARTHRSRAETILNTQLNLQQIDREYIRLAALLRANIFAFERKTYVNLSHASNKAMNLNAYIGLIGKHFKEVGCEDGIVLTECAKENAKINVPAADLLLTLDADSFILSDYAMRLVQVMQSDAHIAVAQTPYCTFPNAPTSLERAAAATTDIQYLSHQGSSHFNAAYWVGANALLRVSALRDIKIEVTERGYNVPLFIQDRTVIEDTGSTLDLVRKGWTVYNYPERLAYSATPPDFGALIIQRRRWSNGGLIILPDLVRYAIAAGRPRAGIAEAFVRLQYLISPTTGTICVLALLLYPFDPILYGIWLPLIAGPYYFVYGRDLVRAGYRWIDLVRVYALGLMLLPINLAGVMLSIVQAITGRKASFGRTPKVGYRTTVPPIYFAFNALMGLVMLGAVGYRIATENYAQVFFPMFNGAFYIYGLIILVGMRAAWNDATRVIRNYLAKLHRQSILRDRRAALAARTLEAAPAAQKRPLILNQK